MGDDKNQLFKRVPDIEITKKIMNFFNIHDFEDEREFTRKTLEISDTVKKINDSLEEILEYYIPCKIDKFLKNLDEKKCITILRQFLKPHGFKIKAREKYFEGKKTLLYKMEKIKPEEIIPNVNLKLKIIEF